MTWLEWLEQADQYVLAKLTAWFAGITVALGTLRRVWPWVKRFVKMVDTIADLPEKMDELDERLDVVDTRLSTIDKSQAKIEHELTTNHGSSLKDAVDRTEKALDVHIQFCIQREKLMGEKPKTDRDS